MGVYRQRRGCPLNYGSALCSVPGTRLHRSYTQTFNSVSLRRDRIIDTYCIGFSSTWSTTITGIDRCCFTRCVLPYLESGTPLPGNRVEDWKKAEFDVPACEIANDEEMRSGKLGTNESSSALTWNPSTNWTSQNHQKTSPKHQEKNC